MVRGLTSAVVACTLVVCVDLRAQQQRPDLQGFWTNATVTPLERPAAFKDKPTLTAEEAAEFEKGAMERMIKALPPEDQIGADLNEVYLETSSMKLVDGRRTALIVDPPDGRLPAQLPEARQRAASPSRKRSFDDPETLTLDERCLMGTAVGSSQIAAPIVPNLVLQNYYQIVQTPQFVVIYTELVHDVRVIRMAGTHVPPAVQRWAGDSIGHWDGNTLVVDTTNFTPKTHFRGSAERMHVVERFTRVDRNTIQYRATVEDPDTWPAPWTIEYPFSATTQPVLEYACHEANYSLENTLRGQRAQEREKR